MMKILIVPLSLIAGLASSCDPVHDILIVNETNNVAFIVADATIAFQPRVSDSVTSKWDTSGERAVQFSVPPDGQFLCGSAIAGIDNDLPFRDIVIRFGSDSLVARTEKEVKELFDKNSFGGQAKPYRITLKASK